MSPDAGLHKLCMGMVWVACNAAHLPVTMWWNSEKVSLCR